MYQSHGPCAWHGLSGDKLEFPMKISFPVIPWIADKTRQCRHTCAQGRMVMPYRLTTHLLAIADQGFRKIGDPLPTHGFEGFLGRPGSRQLNDAPFHLGGGLGGLMICRLHSTFWGPIYKLAEKCKKWWFKIGKSSIFKMLFSSPTQVFGAPQSFGRW